jgi:outer membrane immunogenic protein
MRKVILLVAAMFALPAITPAVAADLSLPAKEPPYPGAYQWTGFYIGGNGGYEFGSVKDSGTTTVGGVPAAGGVGVQSFSSSANNSGGFGGLQFGFNYEFPSHVVAGFEADADWGNINSSGNSCAVGGCATVSSNINNFGTLRFRLGYALNNVLIYGTGGGAWADTRWSSNLNTATGAAAGALAGLALPANASFSTFTIGYTAGGGFEYGITPNVTFKAEYLWEQFNGVLQTYNYGLNGAGATVVGNHNAAMTLSTVRAGFNILLPAPPGWFR